MSTPRYTYRIQMIHPRASMYAHTWLDCVSRRDAHTQARRASRYTNCQVAHVVRIPGLYGDVARIVASYVHGEKYAGRASVRPE